MRILYALTFYNKVCILKSVQGTHYTDALVSSTGCLYHTSMDDTHIMKSVPTTNYYSATVMYMGRWASYPARIMMQFVFTDALKNAIAPSSITEAKLYLWDQSTDTTRRTVNVRIPRNIWTASTVTWNTAPSYYTGTWNGIPAPTSHTISGDPGWWAFPYMKDVVAAMLRNYIDTSLSQTIHEKRGIMIKLADETVGLKTLRSSNHSENRPNMSITYTPTSSGGAGYYGSARSYDNWKFSQGQYPNCWGYALHKTYAISPKLEHQYSSNIPATEDYCKEIIRTYTNNNISGVTLRSISGASSTINNDEHRIAARMNRYPTPPGSATGSSIYTLQSYHFVVQLNNGCWAHKRNTNPSEYLGNINPETNDSGCWYDVTGAGITSTFFYASKG